MSITAGQTAEASDFVASSAGSGDAGKVPKLDANGLLDNSFLGLTGIIVPTMRRVIPSGWLLCDGQAVSRATYSALFDVLCPFAVFTVTIASPAVFTTTAHGLVAGDKIRITTTGSLPTGLATGTDYYVISAGLSANDFRVSTSRGGAAVNTSGSQSGTHTWRVFNSGVGDGSTTFNLPNLKGKSVFGYDVTDANFDTLDTPNTYVGEKTHALTTGELPSHTHAISSASSSGGSGRPNAGGSGDGGDQNPTRATGSNSAHNNIPPYTVVNFMIRI
jgi:microcystin-dependent protein